MKETQRRTNGSVSDSIGTPAYANTSLTPLQHEQLMQFLQAHLLQSFGPSLDAVSTDMEAGMVFTTCLLPSVIPDSTWIPDSSTISHIPHCHNLFI
ncbi:hypothetical protein VNO77_31707 [Canavalia gladiata]|uniref:Uncharacterized protein n=1 Tax=Canavalia gladiata TaxID=3824 RepID=A0AAN9KP45_CANGL